MPSRSQFLVHTGVLAIGMSLGSVATYFLIPPTIVRVASPVADASPKVPEPTPEISLTGPPVLKDVPKAKPPVLAGAPAADPVAKKEAPPAEKKPTPDEVLAKKGLTRSGPVYVLQAENEIGKEIDNLRVIGDRWDVILVKMDQQEQLLVNCKYALLDVEGAWRSGSGGGNAARAVQAKSSPAQQQLNSELQKLVKQLVPPEELAKQAREKEKKARERDKDGDDENGNPPAPLPGGGQNWGESMPGQLPPGVPGMGPGKQESRPRPDPVKPKPEQREERKSEKEKDEKEKPEPKKLFVVIPRILLQLDSLQNWRNEIIQGMLVIQNEYFSLEIEELRCIQEFQRQRAAVNWMAGELEQRYARLKEDREVQDALEELNKTANPKFTLGPRESYRENLAKMTRQRLRKEGLKKDAGGKFQFSKVAVVADNVWKAEDELRDALSRQKQLISAKPGAATGKKMKPGVDKEARKVEAAAERRKLGLEIAAKREIYVQRVESLRKLVDELRRKAPELEKEHGIAIRQQHDIVNELVKAEKTITSKVIELKPDKSIFRVKTYLNDQEAEMVLEPTVDEIRISAASVDALGIKLEGVGKPETVTLKDGREVAGDRFTLKSVKVGPCTAQNVECVVITEGFDSPPLLGGSFLNRYACRLDPDAEKITLTLVELKPPTHRK